MTLFAHLPHPFAADRSATRDTSAADTSPDETSTARSVRFWHSLVFAITHPNGLTHHLDTEIDLTGRDPIARPIPARRATPRPRSTPPRRSAAGTTAPRPAVPPDPVASPGPEGRAGRVPPRSSAPHTVVLSQLEAINERLSARHLALVITAEDLGLTGEAVDAGTSASSLPAQAVLVRICADGPPDFPYIHGHFALGEQDAGSGVGAARLPERPVVGLHTAALRVLSRRVGLVQRWGL